MINLENCPFCNSVDPESIYAGNLWHVQCHGCLACGPRHKDKNSAYSLWNIPARGIDNNSDYDRLVKDNNHLAEKFCLCKRDRDYWVACAMHAIRRLSDGSGKDVFETMKSCLDFVMANKDKVTRT